MPRKCDADKASLKIHQIEYLSWTLHTYCEKFNSYRGKELFSQIWICYAFHLCNLKL